MRRARNRAGSALICYVLVRVAQTRGRFNTTPGQEPLTYVTQTSTIVCHFQCLILCIREAHYGQ